MTDITIQGWMKSLMCLKGMDLVVYATIHSLEDHEVSATAQEICKHVAFIYDECQKTRVLLTLAHLREEGLIRENGGAYSIVDEEIAKACV